MGATPLDRGKPGSKLHLVCDGSGLPLTVVATAANLADTTMAQAVIDDLPPVRTPAGRRRSRPEAVHADKGVCHEALCDRWGEPTHRWAVAAARLKLRAPRPGSRQAGWEQP